MYIWGHKNNHVKDKLLERAKTCKYTGSQNLGTKTVFGPYWHWLDPPEHYTYDFSSVQSSGICDKPLITRSLVIINPLVPPVLHDIENLLSNFNANDTNKEISVSLVTCESMDPSCLHRKSRAACKLYVYNMSKYAADCNEVKFSVSIFMLKGSSIWNVCLNYI